MKHLVGIVVWGQFLSQQLKTGASKSPSRSFTPTSVCHKPLPFSSSLSSSSSLEQTKLLTQYILNLGKYDQSYDIRDRTRFIRQLIVPNEKSGALNKYARRILLAPKPAPVLESTFKGTSYIFNVKLSSIFSDVLAPLNELKVWD